MVRHPTDNFHSPMAVHADHYGAIRGSFIPSRNHYFACGNYEVDTVSLLSLARNY
jgi:hypothetical protein